MVIFTLPTRNGFRNPTFLEAFEVESKFENSSSLYASVLGVSCSSPVSRLYVGTGTGLLGKGEKSRGTSLLRFGDLSGPSESVMESLRSL